MKKSAKHVSPKTKSKANKKAPTTDSSTKAIVAHMEQVTKVYDDEAGKVTALDRVDVDFYQASFTAVMGPSGSGKSTLLQCLAGLDSINSGKITIKGQEISQMSDSRLTKLRREQIGFIFQAFNLVPTLTAEENITLPIKIAGGEVDRELFDKIVKTLGIQDRLDFAPSNLSGGQQQRVAAARALLTRPAIVFADEPSGNLDSKSAAALLEFLKIASSDFDQAIVMVTHDAVAASYASRVLFLDDGKIVDEMFNPTTAKILDKLKSLGDYS